MNFNKAHRREPTEPQLATMIDVFSILIIFLIAGTTMDSSIMEIPADLIMAETISKSISVNAPQVTLKNNEVNINFINEKLKIEDLDPVSTNTEAINKVTDKVRAYLANINLKNNKNPTDLQLLKSINLVADRDVPYKNIFNTIKFFRNLGFQNSILVGTDVIKKTK
jgi:biopolymer transport protein ExbD